MSKFLDEFGLARVWANIKNYIDSKIGSGEAEDVYSTEETRIGTWIDGKPLYRKVFLTSIPDKSGLSNLATLENISDVVELIGIITTKTGYTIQISYCQGDQYASLMLTDKNFLTINCNIVSLLGQPLTVIFEYTKTTD